ncbi:MAG TPA: HAD-IC family P-type ATPase [Gammaproteobacteria bacterium]|nr:HAD-IC family P-type ATPase [Gammaproteobacteria bacterium]
MSVDAVLDTLGTTSRGLAGTIARERLQRHGRNVLPERRPPGILTVFLRQFLSPFIYVLLAAAAVAAIVGEWLDAGFIGAVLLLNAVIGATQEYQAQRSAEALRHMLVSRARVIRDGEGREVDSTELVPGDVVLLEPGTRVQADMRLIHAEGVEIDESLLTGESMPVAKRHDPPVPDSAPPAERATIAHAGTMVVRGRARGVVVATGRDTELGGLAGALGRAEPALPPLLQRMRRFTWQLAAALAVVLAIIGGIGVAHGEAPAELLLAGIALAVSAVPEGLPVALTVALAIGVSRMARRHVITRRLVAVEALGSCTVIATDKTGTLTMNSLTARELAFPGTGERWEASGEGTDPEGFITPESHNRAADVDDRRRVDRLARTAVLCNEGFLGRRDGDWVHGGDPMDVALLVLGHKAGLSQAVLADPLPETGRIPYEPEHAYAASMHADGDDTLLCVKGAPEKVLAMCSRMAARDGDVPLDRGAVEGEIQRLARAGYRVLAFGDGVLPGGKPATLEEERLRALTFIGLAGVIDPPRPEVHGAIEICHRAGIRVCMVTGDHADTALAVAREIGIGGQEPRLLTGADIRALAERPDAERDRVIAGGDVFARVEPTQKLEIVRSLARSGEYVAVTGDGVNDAPALANAHVGVAMGRRGTDVARESADIIVTDDNFASIAAGIEGGRVAYQNIRKVIFLLISTGAAELVLFLLGAVTGLPLPLTAVQLLWLNLVTNGIQDVGLAFEPAEGGEMARPPRRPGEPIFDRVMVPRVAVSGLVMGGLGFAVFGYLLRIGVELETARNLLLLLMVLFENVQVFNARSERVPVLRHNPLRNPLLLFGTLAAQGIHIVAMFTPGLSAVLEIAPVRPVTWTGLFGLALTLLVALEALKRIRLRGMPGRAA